MLGGMMQPIVPAEEMTAAAKSGLYFFSTIIGTMKEPMAETVAAAEPEIAPKNMQATTVTIARPPVMKPTKHSAMSTMRREIPP